MYEKKKRLKKKIHSKSSSNQCNTLKEKKHVLDKLTKTLKIQIKTTILGLSKCQDW